MRAALCGALAVLAAAPSAAFAQDSPLTDPVQIERLASDAYVWGLAPEFVYRFQKYNTLVTAPLNALGGGGAAAAWNNNATNAGDASVLYLNSMMDLSGKKGRGRAKELVLTVPRSKRDYYVVNLLDAFINSIGSIGTRTTPSRTAQTYLIAGPTSRYAHRRVAWIRGFKYRVMTSDTDLNWRLIRIRADTLVPAADPASAASVYDNVVRGFAMSTLREFQARGHRPKYFRAGTYTPSRAQVKRAAKWHNAPASAVAFFEQLGASLRLNPLPDAETGLNGVPLGSLPSWVVPQYGARERYRNPSDGQARTLARFEPLGLTADGYRLPSNWGPVQFAALQAGYEAGQDEVNDTLSSVAVDDSTNYWGYLNDLVGTYPNTPQGYLYRAVIVLAGGSANVPLDAVYAQINTLDGTPSTQIDGNGTYKLTFTPPVTDPLALPVIGSLPPTVNDPRGNPRGFWSIHAYQTDTTQSAAPFIAQASVLNTAYSNASLEVTAVDPASDTITVKPSAWGPLVASTPIFFDADGARYGLEPGAPYYVATTPRRKGRTYAFKISRQWRQELSDGGVPIQGASGSPGPVVDLTDPGGPVQLRWGPIQPVSQLGSQQLASGKLAKNADGSVTIWIGPTRPAGAPATNWLPTPSSAYYEGLYPDDAVAIPQIRPMIRIYYPTPGSDTEASILPPPNGSMDATYVFPTLENVY